MNIDYQANKFARCIYGRKLIGNKVLQFSKSELIHSAIMVGKSNIFDYMILGITGIHEIIFRVSFLNSLIKENGLHQLQKSVNYKTTFDPSEKGFASYYLGNVFTKLVSTKLLNVTLLLHYDLYRLSLPPLHIQRFNKSKTKPDFIGRNSKNEWVLLESKGRSNTYDSTAIINGKNQLASIYSINGLKPSLKCVVESYFTNDIVNLYIEDPEGNMHCSRIDVDLDLFESLYYRLILKVLIESIDNLYIVDIDTSRFYCVTIEKIGIIVGLKKEIFIKLTNQNSNISEKMSNEEKAPLNTNKINYEDFCIGKDGVLISVTNDFFIDNNRLNQYMAENQELFDLYHLK